MPSGCVAAPTPMRANERAASDRRSCSAASIGSSAIPRARPNTLVDPPGNEASAVVVPTNPHAASLSVPSPASTTTTSTPACAASLASFVASPRWAVSTTSTSCSAARAAVIGARARVVTFEAIGLTIIRRRTAANHTRTIRRCPTGPQTDCARSPTRSSPAARARGSLNGANASPRRSAPRFGRGLLGTPGPRLR